MTLCALLTGCLFTYLVRSGYEQIKILSDREPIENILQQNDLPQEYRHKLKLALKIRSFAATRLHLKMTENYKTFVDLKRPFVTYIVTVAKKWELEPNLYWYPLVGKLPYKGFFDKDSAEQEAKGFDTNNYDVMVRGVTAYSTLGWFNDPLLSTMLSKEDHYLVNLIIHESTHATLYYKSQADFNEQLATFIGNIGTEIYYKESEGDKSKSLGHIVNENYDEKLFSEFISVEINKLKQWYKTSHGLTDADREARFQEILDKFDKNVRPQLLTDVYKNFSKTKLNNAVLLYYKTYMFDLGDFQKLYDHFNQDIEKFITFCKTLEKNTDPRQAITTYLSSTR
ncbi:MAG: hypothetical protein A2Z20_08100 [Bdellovibrionales bacterium RBG_16_40_8]|nr:MAG: hypothetical protein A2Z20_08100 [Bdellovibrionales bacterium RBG_16_40_8]